MKRSETEIVYCFALSYNKPSPDLETLHAHTPAHKQKILFVESFMFFSPVSLDKPEDK